MRKFLTQINNLITGLEVRTLRRAAKILTKSDRHDELFFNLCKEECDAKSPNVIAIGQHYQLVQVSRVVPDTVATTHDSEV